jgi:hypothetical protein
MKKSNRKFKAQPKVKAEGIKIPKKYTTGDKEQASKMAKEIKKFKGPKTTNPFFQWTGDTDPKTGKRYKSKPSVATKAFNKKYSKKK